MASGVVSSLVLGAVLLRAHAVSETVLHPSNRRVVTCADGLLRPIWVSATKTMADCQGAAVVNDTDTYANAVQYASHGAVTQLNFGNCRNSCQSRSDPNLG